MAASLTDYADLLKQLNARLRPRVAELSPATQALLTLNGEFTAERAAAFAEELSSQHAEPQAQVAAALERALGRPADGGEVARNLAFLERLTAELDVAERDALELFLLGLFNRNEFLWLD